MVGRSTPALADEATTAERAAERSFADHHRAVYAYALRRLGDHVRAEDVVAEVFAVRWRRRKALAEPELPWLYAVARRVIANLRRSERRAERLQARLAAEPSRREEPDERLGLVRSALLELPERDRELLMLIAWEGLSQREAAKALGCTYAALRLRLMRARRRFERALRADRSGLNRSEKEF